LHTGFAAPPVLGRGQRLCAAQMRINGDADEHKRRIRQRGNDIEAAFDTDLDRIYEPWRAI
jgi:deoxyadenosine/deoxycytidine kinase